MDYQDYIGIEKHSSNDLWGYMLESLEREGFYIFSDILDLGFLERVRSSMDAINSWQNSNYDPAFLKKIGDHGVLRSMFEHDKIFFECLTHDFVDEVLRLTTGETSILHLQNGIYNTPLEEGRHNQARYHKDFPKNFLSSKMLSINIFFIIDDFTGNNGATWVVPGSHLFEKMPSERYIKEHEVQISAKAGSVLVFNSFLWHKAGENHSKKVRRGINQQFTKPFIKQQLDYPAYMRDKVDIESKLAQRLGLWTLPPKGVAEYRVDNPKLRTYRAGQG